MRGYLHLFCTVVLIFFAAVVKVAAQGASNKGTDFWFLYAPHVSGYSASMPQRMSVYITSDVNTTGKIEIPGINYSANFSVTANQVTIVSVPQTAYSGGVEGQNNKGIHLTSVKPIVAYGHIYNSQMSGATLLLPTNTLGKDYYSLNYTQKANSANAYSFCAIVATEDNTQIVITPTVTTQGGMTANVERTITLNKGEVYQIFGKQTSEVRNSSNEVTLTTGDDLTGTTIKSVAANGQSCKRIAVFSGSTRISVGCATATAPGSADNLFQQVYPTSTWGKSFVTVPSKNRNYDIYRVFKSTPTAVVKLNGTVIPNTNFTNNLYYEFSSQQTNYIESDNTIQVVQYQVTQGKQMSSGSCTSISGDVGDPEMIFLNPLEQTLDKMTMYSSPFYKILRHYINVVIKTADVAGFTLDGISQASFFNPVPSKAGYSYAQIEVSEGTHTLQANGGFNAIAYGFGANESYGYAAGASLISPGIEAIDEVSGLKKEVGCINEKYDLYVSLPYQPLSIKLDLDNGQAPANLPLELAETYTSNNIVYYKYKLISQLAFTDAKKYLIKVTAEKPISDGCGAVDELQLEYEVQDKPIPSFEVVGDRVCDGIATTFKDTSQGNGNDIAKWHWDFGNGQTEVKTMAATFTHTYAPGTYTAKLFVENQAGCISQVFSKDVKVYALPVAKFIATTTSCENRVVKFEDQSTSVDGTITNWLWDFGDGQTSTVKNIEHTYARAGLYEVSLTVKSANGCAVTVKKEFKVNGSMVAAFEVVNQAKLCSNDPVVFKDLATIDFGEISKIEWYFDYTNKTTPDIVDGTPALRAETTKSYTFKYPTFSNIVSKNYIVRMVVYTDNSCVAAVQKTITLTALPQIEFAQAMEICLEAPSVQLMAKETNAIQGIGVFSGDGVSASGVFNPASAGVGTHQITYTFTVPNGCTVEKTQLVTVNEIPVVDAGEDKTILEGGQTALLATATGAHLKYKWSPSEGLSADDILNPIAKPTKTTKYTLTVTSDGCNVIVAEVMVKVIENPLIPNVFSPNGDGKNDTWNIKYLETFTEGNITIFNRYGQKVFQASPYNTPWDGKMNGADLPIGVYYYIIEPNNGRKKYTGSVTILR